MTLHPETAMHAYKAADALEAEGNLKRNRRYRQAYMESAQSLREQADAVLKSPQYPVHERPED